MIERRSYRECDMKEVVVSLLFLPIILVWCLVTLPINLYKRKKVLERMERTKGVYDTMILQEIEEY
jgi:hypothetical protein